MSLRADGVRWSAGGRLILDGVSLEVGSGEVVGLLGPNGSGKSSLLALLAGLRTPTTGSVLLDGQDLARMRRRAVAQRVAVVAQHATTDVALRVIDVVRLGRIPHASAWGGRGAADELAVARAIEQTELVGFTERRWATLSGGERQRVQIARALAQEPTELLLDEPTNHLDVHHQLELLALVRRLGRTTVVALHDLNLAAMFCDRLVVLAGGRVVAQGAPAEVLTAELIDRVFHARALVTAVPDQPALPHVRFLPPSVPTPKGPPPLSRSHLLRAPLAAAALALTLGAAACGTDDTSKAADAGTTPGAVATGPVRVENCDRTVALDRPAQRAVAISQPAIELLLTLGLQDRMVGAAGWNDPVPAALKDANAKVPQLGKDFPSFERVLEQQPDLVYSTFAWGFTDEGVAPRAKFERLGVATYQSPSECSGQEAEQVRKLTIDDVYAEVGDVGRLFGVEDRAAKLVAELKARQENAAGGVKAKGVKLAWWYAATKAPYIAGCCGAPGIVGRAVGAENAFEGQKQLWPEISWEAILKADPDVLVLADLSRGGDGDSAKAKLEFLRTDPVARRLTAVREHRLIVVPGAAMDPGIRNVAAIEAVAQGLRKLDLGA